MHRQSALQRHNSTSNHCTNQESEQSLFFAVDLRVKGKIVGTLVPEKSLFLYLFICKHTDVGGGLLAKGIFPICQYGAIEESQVFTLRVMKLELGTAQRGSQTHTTAQCVQCSFCERPEEGDKDKLLCFHLCFAGNRDTVSCPCKDSEIQHGARRMELSHHAEHLCLVQSPQREHAGMPQCSPIPVSSPLLSLHSLH